MTLALFAAAGRGTRLVGRPTSDVAHLYTGRLTRSGRHVPRRRRVACGARTRRLSVLPFPATLDPALPGARRVCGRCRAVLTARDIAGLAASRDQLVATYGHLTAAQLASHATVATTRDEIELVALLELALLTRAAACAGLPSTSGRSLHQIVVDRRARLRAAEPTRDEAARDERKRANDAAAAETAARVRRRDQADLEAERARRRARRARPPRHPRAPVPA